MSDLAGFLLARIGEDEDAARRAAFGYGANWTNETDDGEGWSAVHADGQRDMVGCEDRDVTGHIARHDPARVLAECDAKRRIVARALAATEEHQRAVRAAPIVATPGRALRQGEDAGWWGALCLVAQPYADHPDYREEWKP